MAFCEEVQIKPPTILNSLERKKIFDGTTVEREISRLNLCKTKEEITKESDLLLCELESIESRKKLGYDISEELDGFKKKFKHAKELKEDLIFQENLKREMAEKCNRNFYLKKCITLNFILILKI